MIKKHWLLLLILFLSSGCTPSVKDFVMARIWMFKAENTYAKAYSLKFKKVPYEKRLPYYREACGYFYRAYELDSGAFTLNRIHEGTDSCWRVEDKEKEEIFTLFEESYAQAHPKEYEYGDTDATIPE